MNGGAQSKAEQEAEGLTRAAVAKSELFLAGSLSGSVPFLRTKAMIRSSAQGDGSDDHLPEDWLKIDLNCM
ncbi:hypothetical protein TYRP_019301, partial [Tyrophagus putrescentiae]